MTATQATLRRRLGWAWPFRQSVALLLVTYTGWPKKQATNKLLQIFTKSYYSQPLRLDVLVKLKQQSSSVIVFLGIRPKHFVRCLLHDVPPPK